MTIPQPDQSPRLVIEERDGFVAILTLNNPAKRNALSNAMRAELVTALTALETDKSVRAIILTGAQGHFCSGADLTGMHAPDIAARREFFRVTHEVVRLMIQSSKPIIAAVEGWAAGAGMSLLCACDTIIAAEGARFVASFPKIGLMGDLGLLHTLPARVGMGAAKQILMYAQPLDAPRAHEIGLIDKLVPAGTALEQAKTQAQQFELVAPLAIAMTKSVLAQGLDEALALERNVQSMLLLSDDFHEGKAAFLEKRKPSFLGS